MAFIHFSCCFCHRIYTGTAINLNKLYRHYRLYDHRSQSHLSHLFFPLVFRLCVILSHLPHRTAVLISYYTHLFYYIRSSSKYTIEITTNRLLEEMWTLIIFVFIGLAFIARLFGNLLARNTIYIISRVFSFHSFDFDCLLWLRNSH